MSNSSAATAPRRHPGRARRLLALAALMGTAVLWGSTFFSMKGLSESMPVTDMLAVRFLMAALAAALLGFRFLRMDARTARRGAGLGLIYAAGQLVQTFGLHLTTASNTAFITGLYVVFTPIVTARLSHRRVPRVVWAAVLLAIVGLGVMTLDLAHGIQFGLGDLLSLLAAGVYTGHIVATDFWIEPQNSMQISVMQLAVVAVVCMVAALPGGVALPRGGGQWLLMLYIAVVAGTLPIFLQMWGQAIVDPTTAAVLMAGEPVWASVFSVTLGGEHATWQMVLGGGAMFAAMMMVTVLPRLRQRRREQRRAAGPAAPQSVPARSGAAQSGAGQPVARRDEEDELRAERPAAAEEHLPH